MSRNTLFFFYNSIIRCYRDISKSLAFYMLSLFFLFLFTSNSFATNYYVDNSATGNNTGVSWDNAWHSFGDISWGSISPGDNLFISGGINSKRYNESLNIQASGIVNAPITISVGQSYPHNGKVIIDLNFAQNYGIFISSQSNVIVTGKGSTSYYGIVVTETGEDGLFINYPTNVEVSYIEFINIGDDNSDRGANITNIQGGGNKLHHCHIDTTYSHGIRVNTGSYNPSNYDRLHIFNNEIENFGEDGIILGAFAEGTSIFNNKIHSHRTDGVGYYSDGIQCLSMRFIAIYNNEIFDLNNSAAGANAAIYFENSANASPDVHHVLIYNNLIYDNAHYDDEVIWGISFAMKNAEKLGVNGPVRICNNTVVDMNTVNFVIDFYNLSSSTTDDVIIVNNLIWNSHTTRNTDRRQWVLHNQNTNITFGSHGDIADVIFDYNVGNCNSGGAVYQFKGRDYSYQDFITACDCNKNGSNAVPKFINWSFKNSKDLRLDIADKAALNLGISRPEYFTDIDGTDRNNSENWDIGAYELAPNTNVSDSLYPPENLRIAD